MSGIEILFLVFGIIVFISIFLLMYAPSTLESKEMDITPDKTLSEEAADFIQKTTDPIRIISTAFFVGIGFVFLYPIISIISEYSQPIRYILISFFYIAPLFAMWCKVKYNNNWFIAVIISIFFIFGFIHLSKVFEKKYGSISNNTPTNVYSEKETKNVTPQVSQFSSAKDLAKQANGESSISESINTSKPVVEEIKKSTLSKSELEKRPYTNAILEAQKRLRDSNYVVETPEKK